MHPAFNTGTTLDSYQASNPQFAFFLPVRNGADYICQAIQSTIDLDSQDWTLYVLDNCSDDDTVDIVRSFADDRIELHLSLKSLGIWESFNRICELIKTGHVTAPHSTILGHDDYYFPNFLSEAEALIKRHSEASFYQLPSDIVNAEGKLTPPSRPVCERETAEDYIAARLWAQRDSFGIGFVFTTANYLHVGGIPNFPLLLFADDLLFARLAELGYTANSSIPACAYRAHRRSAFGIFSAQRLISMFRSVQLYLHHLDEEFPTFTASPRGKAAIACLLAQEIMVLHATLIIKLLAPADRERLYCLATSYYAIARGAHYQN